MCTEPARGKPGEIIPASGYTQNPLLPPSSTTWQWAEHHHRPPTAQQPVWYTASAVILLTSKTHHMICVLKTTSGSHLTWSRSQGHHSGLEAPHGQLPYLSLTVSAICPHLTSFSPHHPPALPQTCQPHSCLRTFARALTFTGMLFPSYGSLSHSLRTSLKCHLLCEERPALSDLFLSMALTTL